MLPQNLIEKVRSSGDVAAPASLNEYIKNVLNS